MVKRGIGKEIAHSYRVQEVHTGEGLHSLLLLPKDLGSRLCLLHRVQYLRDPGLGQLLHGVVDSRVRASRGSSFRHGLLSVR